MNSPIEVSHACKLLAHRNIQTPPKDSHLSNWVTLVSSRIAEPTMKQQFEKFMRLNRRQAGFRLL